MEGSAVLWIILLVILFAVGKNRAEDGDYECEPEGMDKASSAGIDDEWPL